MRKAILALTALLLLFVMASCSSLKVRMGESSDFHLLPLLVVSVMKRDKTEPRVRGQPD